MDDERSDKDETDESEEDEEEEGEGKKNMKKNGPVQNGHTAHNNNHSKTEWKQTSVWTKECEKDSYPSVGDTGGRDARRKRRAGVYGSGSTGASPLKNKNRGYPEDIWHWFFAQHQNTLTHMSICTFRGHRDPADDSHYNI